MSNLMTLAKFALENLYAIVKLERRKYGSTSSDLYLRLDISVMKNSQGQWMWVINKYKRLPNGCLFATDESADLHVGPLAFELSRRLPEECSRTSQNVAGRWWSFVGS